MSEWQPIETAPKDGSKVDLWDRAGFRWTDQHWGVHYWENGKPKSAPAWGRAGLNGPEPDPTHWMPLPEPPQ